MIRRASRRGKLCVGGILMASWEEAESEAEVVGAGPKIRGAEPRRRHLSVSHKPTQIPQCTRTPQHPLVSVLWNKRTHGTETLTEKISKLNTRHDSFRASTTDTRIL